MTQQPTSAEWDAFAPQWITRCAQGEANRDGFLDRAMWGVIGPVGGLQAIDIACGEGRFCRQLAAHGVAGVLGIDLCEPLLVAAERLKSSPRESYRRDDMLTLATVPAGAFDLAISYIALVDIPNVAAAARAAARVLKPGGRYVVCNLSPMATAVGRRMTEPGACRGHIRVAGYFAEGARAVRFGAQTLTNYHCTLTTYIRAFLEAGLTLSHLVEPCPTPAEIATRPDLANEVDAPAFIIYDLRKAG